MLDLPARQQALGLLSWLLVSFITAGIGAAASVTASSFYGSLERPAWAPPAAVFAPVWTTLFAMMGIAAWLVWRRGGFAAARGALSLFLIQLALNALWSWLFFGWHRGAWAFADILLLWAAMVATTVAFWRVQALAGLLFVPYRVWVSFAVVLSYTVWQMNPHRFG